MRLKIFYLFVLLVFSIALSIFVGPIKVPFDFWFLKNKSYYETIVYDVRLPRIILSCVVGGSMSLAGVVYQSVFRNPLASPDILGTAFGCAFGAAVGILLSGNLILIQLFSLISGILSTFAVFYIARKDGHIDILSLVISGIIVGSFFSSLLGLAKYFADPDNKLPAITFWLMGSFSDVGYKDVAIGLVCLIPICVIYYKRWFLNVANLEDEEAIAIGFDIHRFRILMIGLSTLLVSISISLVGIIGWVGLVVPHMARLVVGYDNKYVVVASLIIGALFVLLCDDIARSLTTGEIPIGIVTSFISAPLFGFLYKMNYAKNK
ncbi:MAG: FecCD family ABC transporter permease [Hydrogenobaculum sp.]